MSVDDLKEKIKHLRKVIERCKESIKNAKKKATDEARTCSYAEKYMHRQHHRLEEIANVATLTIDGEEFCGRDTLMKIFKRGVY